MEVERFRTARRYLTGKAVAVTYRGRQNWTFKVGKYDVLLSDRFVSCTCPHGSMYGTKRLLPCGHVLACLYLITGDEAIPKWDALTPEEQERYEEPL